MTEIVKCTGSGGMQMIDWDPDDKVTDEHPKGYPGAVVCLGCSYGVLVVRGSVHQAVSGVGREGLAGKVRVHYLVKDRHAPVPYQAMAYRKGDLKGD